MGEENEHFPPPFPQQQNNLIKICVLCSSLYLYPSVQQKGLSTRTVMITVNVPTRVTKEPVITCLPF